MNGERNGGLDRDLALLRLRSRHYPGLVADGEGEDMFLLGSPDIDRSGQCRNFLFRDHNVNWNLLMTILGDRIARSAKIIFECNAAAKIPLCPV